MTMLTRRAILQIFAAALALFLSKNLSGSPGSPLPADSLDAAPSRFATLEGAKVHYKSLGDPAARTAVVFVHGWSCDLTSWRAQVPAFEGKARMLLVDLPGHGKSDRPDVDYTMERFGRAVEAVTRDAGVERALFVGHSMGTPVIREFARKYPQKTLGLVAVDGALRLPKMERGQLERQPRIPGRQRRRLAEVAPEPNDANARTVPAAATGRRSNSRSTTAS